MKKCAFCGEIVEDGLLTCNKCGRGIFESEKIPARFSFFEKVKPKKISNFRKTMIYFKMKKAAREAKEWWSANPDRTEGKCDRCLGVIPRGKGYLVGPKHAYIQVHGSPEAQKEIYDTMLSSGLATTPDMLCKNCLIKYSDQPWAIPWSVWLKKLKQKGDLP